MSSLQPGKILTQQLVLANGERNSRVKWQESVLFIILMRITPSHGLQSKHAQGPADGADDSEWAHRCFPTQIPKLSLIVFPYLWSLHGHTKKQFGQGIFKDIRED